MKKVLGIVSALVLSAAVPAFAQSQPPADSVIVGGTAPGKAALARSTKITATVVSVDAAKREVVLKGPRGHEMQVTVGPAVRNLDKVKVGDHVGVEYVEALTLTLMKDGKELPSAHLSDAGVRAKPGADPAGAVAQRLEITADVTAVNRKKGIVTLKGPERTIDLPVKDPEQLKLIKVGDQVQAVYTEAIAMALEPVKARKK